VQKGSADIQVALPPVKKESGRRRIYDHADRGHDHDGPAVDGDRRSQPMHGFPRERPHGYQQQDGVAKAREDGAASPSVPIIPVIGRGT
jgi:hypothetical protein